MAASARGSSPKTGDIELGRKIAARREELGMSRKDLAEAIGLSYPFVAQIETGYRLPSAKHHLLLSRVLGLSLDELFDTESDLPAAPERIFKFAVDGIAPTGASKRTTLEEAVEYAAQEIESLPARVRLSALNQLQLRIMEGVTEDALRTRR